MTKMSHRYYLFAVIFIFLFLLICVAPSVFALTSTNTITNTPAANNNNIEIFKLNEDKLKPLKIDGTNENNKEITVKSFYSPFIVAADDVMIALAEVNYSEKQESGSESSAQKTELLTKYIEMKKKGETSSWVENVMKKEEKDKNWKAQFATKDWKKAFVVAVLKNNTADAKTEKKNIYFIAINCTSTVQDSASKYDFMIVNGTISSNDGAKKIKWDTKKFDSNSLKNEFLDKLSETSPFAGSALFVHEKNNRIMFAVTGKGKNGDDNNHKYISALIEIKENMGKLELLNVTDISDGCYPYFLPWEGKIIMISTICSGNTNTVMMEFDEEKKEWKKHREPLSRLMKYLSDKKDFTTLSIGDNKAILFTEQKTKNNKKYDVNLWVSDGKRLKSVGSITSDVDSATHMDLLYTSGELFSLHNQSKDSDNKNILTHLKKQLKTIKDALDAWKNSDVEVSKLCGTEAATETGSCNNMSTEGIVGWLSDGGEDNTEWKNKYLYVNATVTEGTKVTNGFKFDRVGAGAKWLVGEINDNQPYNFTDSGFTLVATVTVDSVGKGGKDNSVLGVCFKENKRIGLLCTKDNKWKISGNEGESHKTVINEQECHEGKMYKMALLLNNNKYSVYVDGEQLGEAQNEVKHDKEQASITHFYFGVDNGNDQKSTTTAESHVTITNVLLYNRPFTNEEVKKLKILKLEKPEITDSNPNNKDTERNTEKDGGAKDGGDGDEGLSDKSKNTDNTNSENGMTTEPENSTVRGGIVLFLLLLLLNLCTNAFCG